MAMGNDCRMSFFICQHGCQAANASWQRHTTRSGQILQVLVRAASCCLHLCVWICTHGPWVRKWPHLRWRGHWRGDLRARLSTLCDNGVCQCRCSSTSLIRRFCCLRNIEARHGCELPHRLVVSAAAWAAGLGSQLQWLFSCLPAWTLVACVAGT